SRETILPSPSDRSVEAIATAVQVQSDVTCFGQLQSMVSTPERRCKAVADQGLAARDATVAFGHGVRSAEALGRLAHNTARLGGRVSAAAPQELQRHLRIGRG